MKRNSWNEEEQQILTYLNLTKNNLSDTLEKHNSNDVSKMTEYTLQLFSLEILCRMLELSDLILGDCVGLESAGKTLNTSNCKVHILSY